MNSIDALASNGRSERPTARNEQWYVETRAGILPMAASAIADSLQRGVLQPSTKAWKSGMQAWQPLASIVDLAPPLDTPLDTALADTPLDTALDTALDRALHDAPLPGLDHLDWGPASEAPTPAPIHTLIRPIAHDRRGARAQAKALPPSHAHGSARGLSWLRHRRTWHSVLFSAVAGSVLGLAVYHPLLWRASAEPASEVAEPAPSRAAMPLAAAVPLAAVPLAAVPVPLPQAAPAAPIEAAAEVPAPQAKRSRAQRSKLAARRKLQRPGRTELPAWP